MHAAWAQSAYIPKFLSQRRTSVVVAIRSFGLDMRGDPVVWLAVRNKSGVRTESTVCMCAAFSWPQERGFHLRAPAYEGYTDSSLV